MAQADGLETGGGGVWEISHSLTRKNIYHYSNAAAHSKVIDQRSQCLWASKLHFSARFCSKNPTGSAICSTPSLEQNGSGLFNDPEALLWPLFVGPCEHFLSILLLVECSVYQREFFQSRRNEWLIKLLARLLQVTETFCENATWGKSIRFGCHFLLRCVLNWFSGRFRILEHT